MWTLGVSASAGGGCLALLKGEALMGSRDLGAPGGRGVGLVPAARDLLREAGIAPPDLGLVAVDTGPGSFTGTRIAVAFAKSLGYAAGCAVAAVSSLEARAWGAEAAGILAVALDARRGRFYVAVFASTLEPRRVKRLFEDALLEPEALQGHLPLAPVLWLGDAGARLARPGDRALPERPPAAETVARLGLGAPRLDPLALAPSYLRLVEAQERRLG